MEPAVNQTLNERRVRFEESSITSFALLQQYLERFRIIAAIVGHDFTLKVDYGSPCGGNFFNPENCSITIDPATALLDPADAEFIVGHEGSHRYNTFSPLHPEVKAVFAGRHNLEEVVRQIGINAVFNGIEDPTINRWYGEVYPGGVEKMRLCYERALQGDRPKLYTPEVQICEQLLGFYPLFGQYLSAVICKWFKGTWGEDLDPRVKETLQLTEPFVDQMISTTVNNTGAPERERLLQFMRRYLIFLEGVWPEVRKLVNEDVKEAAFQSFAREVSSEAGKEKGEQEALDGTPEDSPEGSKREGGSSLDGKSSVTPKTSPDESGDPEEFDSLEKVLNQLPQSLRDELKRIASAIKKGDGQPQEGADSAPEAKPTNNRQSEGVRHADKPEGSVGKGGSENGTQARSCVPVSGDTPAKGASPASPSEGTHAGTPVPESMPAQGGRLGADSNPQGKLSRELEGTLRSMFKSLSSGLRGGFEERGKFNLKKFEDALNRFLRANLSEFQVPSHEESAVQKSTRLMRDGARAQEQRVSIQLEEYRISRLGVWQVAQERQGANIVQLTSRLRRIIRPTTPEWQGGYRSGPALNLPEVMQDQGRSVPRHQIFLQKTLPSERSFFVQILSDRSESMEEEDKCVHNLDGVVLASEVFQRLKVPFEIASFSSGFYLEKEVHAPFDITAKDHVACSLLSCGGGTYDYYALRQLTARAMKVRADYKIILATTDGKSNNPLELHNQLLECGKAGIIVIGLGIGPETYSVNTNYPNGKGLLSLTGQGSDSFIGYMAETIQKIVLNPHSFKFFTER